MNKHNNKRKIFLMMLMTMLILLCSCVRSGVDIVIENDGGGTVEASIGINEKYYSMFAGEEGFAEFVAGKQTTKLTDGSDTYICFTESKTFEDIEELEKILLDLKYDFIGLEAVGSDNPEEAVNDARIFSTADVTYEPGLFESKYAINLVTTKPASEVATDEDESEMPELDGVTEMLTGEAYRLVVKVTMPGEVTSETGVVEGNTVTFTVKNLAAETVLAAESSDTNMPMLFGVAVGALVVMAVVIVVIFKGRSKTSE